MIDELEVRNLALIKEASIRPSEKMTVITGETGAGKTALLSACRLIMGQRFDKDMLRADTDRAEVEARLFIDDIEDTNCIDTNSNEYVISRLIGADGRSRARINGRIASVGELSDVVGSSISLCSQHDQVALVRPSSHLSFLDRWAKIGSSPQYLEYENAFNHYKNCQEKLSRLQSDAKLSDSKLAEARFKLQQIDAVEPSIEDYNNIIATLNKARNAEMLARTTSGAHDALSGERGALDLVSEAISLLEEGSCADEKMEELASTLRDTLYVIEDVARDVSRLEDDCDFDASEIDAMQERVSAYHSLMRAYGPEISDVVQVADEARELIQLIDKSDEVLAQAKCEAESAYSALVCAASDLHELRATSSKTFSQKLNEILSRLGMGNSSLECNVSLEDESLWTDKGPDAVSFMFKPTPDSHSRPLAKIASGGELGRVMLALHVAMGNKDATPTLVFDEVDAGIGGQTANALGNEMATLAKTHQVIVVTHSAQIAVLADKHYVVRKSFDEGETHTEIVQLEGDERVKEVARMLSGSLTDASLIHARELLSICDNLQ